MVSVWFLYGFPMVSQEPVPASAAPSLGAPSLEKAAAASVAAAAAAASGDPVAQVKVGTPREGWKKPMVKNIAVLTL